MKCKPIVISRPGFHLTPGMSKSGGDVVKDEVYYFFQIFMKDGTVIGVVARSETEAVVSSKVNAFAVARVIKGNVVQTQLALDLDFM